MYNWITSRHLQSRKHPKLICSNTKCGAAFAAIESSCPKCGEKNSFNDDYVESEKKYAFFMAIGLLAFIATFLVMITLKIPLSLTTQSIIISGILFILTYACSQKLIKQRQLRKNLQYLRLYKFAVTGTISSILVLVSGTMYIIYGLITHTLSQQSAVNYILATAFSAVAMYMIAQKIKSYIC